MIPSLDLTRPLSLYIHIPFCTKKCDYCAFYSKKAENKIIDEYFSILMKELQEIKKEYERPFYTIYIGGGNPALLGYDRLLTLLKSATEYGKSAETTVEVNPENLTPDIFSLYPYADRISIGIQSMHSSVLKTLGRNSTLEDNYKALKLLSHSPFTFNADIITAVPNEKIYETLEDIEIVSSFDPKHISFYCLTMEENTPIIKKYRPIGEEKEREFLSCGWNKLKELGYEHYEISSFAKNNKRSKHNSLYWQLGQYIGLGPTAESFLGYTTGVTMRNTETIEDYLKNPDFQCEEISREETIESYLLTALRTKIGIDKKEYSSRFSSSFDEDFKERIPLIDNSFYINNEDSFSLTEEGFLVLDRIILTLAMAII